MTKTDKYILGGIFEEKTRGQRFLEDARIPVAGTQVTPAGTQVTPAGAGAGSTGMVRPVGAGRSGMFGTIAGGISDIVGGLVRSAPNVQNQAPLTQTLNSTYDTAANAVMAVNPLVGGIMKAGGFASDTLTALGIGTDQETAADKVLDSKFLKLTPMGLVNAIGAKRTRDFSADTETLEQVGGSYGGTAGEISDAVGKAGKKYGKFSSRARKRANAFIAEAERKQNMLEDIAGEATDQANAVNYMGDLMSGAYAFRQRGGYDQRFMRAKDGGALPEAVAGRLLGHITDGREVPLRQEGGLSIQKPEDIRWTPAEKARLAGAVSDFISILDPEPLSSAGLGLASDFSNFYADRQEGMTMGQSLGNLGINAGLSLLGAIPVLGDALGPGTKLVRTISRFGPKIAKSLMALSIYGGVDIGKGVFTTLSKLGKSGDENRLTPQDYRNLIYAVNLITGTTKGIMSGTEAVRKDRASIEDASSRPVPVASDNPIIDYYRKRILHGREIGDLESEQRDLNWKKYENNLEIDRLQRLYNDLSNRRLELWNQIRNEKELNSTIPTVLENLRNDSDFVTGYKRVLRSLRQDSGRYPFRKLGLEASPAADHSGYYDIMSGGSPLSMKKLKQILDDPDVPDEMKDFIWLNSLHTFESSAKNGNGIRISGDSNFIFDDPLTFTDPVTGSQIQGLRRVLKSENSDIDLKLYGTYRPFVFSHKKEPRLNVRTEGEISSRTRSVSIPIGTSTSKITGAVRRYVSDIRKLLQDDAIPGGSAVLIGDGKVSGIPGDVDLITTAARFDNVKKRLGITDPDINPESNGFGIRKATVRDSKLLGGSSDISIIEANRAGNAIGKEALEFYSILYPDKFRKLMKESLDRNVPIEYIPLDITAEQMLQHLVKNPEVVRMKGLVDYLGSFKDKQFPRALNTLTTLSDTEFDNALRLLTGRYMSDFKTARELYPNLRFDDVKANREYLASLGIRGAYADKLVVDEEFIRRLVELQHIQETLSTRRVDPSESINNGSLEDMLLTNSATWNSMTAGSRGGGNTMGLSGVGGGISFGTITGVIQSALTFHPEKIRNTGDLARMYARVSSTDPNSLAMSLEKEFKEKWASMKNAGHDDNLRLFRELQDFAEAKAREYDLPVLKQAITGSGGNFFGRYSREPVTWNAMNTNELPIETGSSLRSLKKIGSESISNYFNNLAEYSMSTDKDTFIREALNSFKQNYDIPDSPDIRNGLKQILGDFYDRQNEIKDTFEWFRSHPEEYFSNSKEKEYKRLGEQRTDANNLSRDKILSNINIADKYKYNEYLLGDLRRPYLERNRRYLERAIMALIGGLGAASAVVNRGQADDGGVDSKKDGGWFPVLESADAGWSPVLDAVVTDRSGGRIERQLDAPETEDRGQKNLIPEGALHRNRHHIEDADGLTKKGIPVVDDDREQQAEIEKEEIIFTREVTVKLEELYKRFYSGDAGDREKDDLAVEAGKLLTREIMLNTDDRAGLIDTLQMGGTFGNRGTAAPKDTVTSDKPQNRPVEAGKPMVKVTYQEWVKTVPEDFLNPSYDLELVFNHLPFERMERWRQEILKEHPDESKAEEWHLPSTIPLNDDIIMVVKKGRSTRDNPELLPFFRHYYEDPEEHKYWDLVYSEKDGRWFMVRKKGVRK